MAFAWPGIFSRYRADDFCFAAAVEKYGWAGAQLVMYRTWAGTYARMLVVSVAQLAGPYVATVLPVLAIIAWSAALAWLIFQACSLAELAPARLIAGVLAPLVIFFTLLEAPNRFQILYWLLGHITYTTPLIFLTALVGCILAAIRSNQSNKIKPLVYAAILLLAFFSGGFSETSIAFQIGVFGLGLVLVWSLARGPKQRPAIGLIAASLLGSLLAMAVIMVAPGNRIRQATLPGPPGLITLIELSLVYAWDFVRIAVKALPLPSLLSLAIPFLVALAAAPVSRSNPPRISWKLVLPAMICYLLIVCSVAPSVYAFSGYPEARSLTPATFGLALCLAATGFMAGLMTRSYLERATEGGKRRIELITAALLIVCSLYPIRAAILTVSQTPKTMIQSAQLWDERNQQLLEAHAQGIQKVTVAALDSQSGVMELGADPNLWVNQCAADYYGLKSITAR